MGGAGARPPERLLPQGSAAAGGPCRSLEVPEVLAALTPSEELGSRVSGDRGSAATEGCYRRWPERQRRLALDAGGHPSTPQCSRTEGEAPRS